MEQLRDIAAAPTFDQMVLNAAGHLTEAREWLAVECSPDAGPTPTQATAQREAMALITQAKLKLAEARTPAPVAVAEPAPAQAPADFRILSVGLVVAAACSSLTNDEAANRLNAAHPTGIESRWGLANGSFPNGDPNGKPCDQHPDTHRHLLFHC